MAEKAGLIEANQPQRVQVCNHLLTHGYITDVVAQSYGIRRLASRIDELKKNGIGIEVEMRRDDLGRRYAYYTLAPRSRSYPITTRTQAEIIPPIRRAA